MKDYVGENQRILDEWEVRINAKENEPNFAPDGILYRGKPGQRLLYVTCF